MWLRRMGGEEPCDHLGNTHLIDVGADCGQYNAVATGCILVSVPRSTLCGCTAVGLTSGIEACFYKPKFVY